MCSATSLLCALTYKTFRCILGVTPRTRKESEKTVELEFELGPRVVAALLDENTGNYQRRLHTVAERALDGRIDAALRAWSISGG